MTEHKSLGEALLAFHAEVPTLRKDATNPHFRSKYTPLDTIVETVGPILTKHGLVWAAFPCRDDAGEAALHYQLTHPASQGVIEGTMPLLLTKADPQGFGSALTYARRYALCSVLNLVSDDDDDGNAASPRQQNDARRSTPTLPAAMRDELRAAAKGLTGAQVRMALASCGIEAPTNIRSAFDVVPADKAALLTECLSGMERDP